MDPPFYCPPSQIFGNFKNFYALPCDAGKNLMSPQILHSLSRPFWPRSYLYLSLAPPDSHISSSHRHLTFLQFDFIWRNFTELICAVQMVCWVQISSRDGYGGASLPLPYHHWYILFIRTRCFRDTAWLLSIQGRAKDALMIVEYRWVLGTI